MKKPLKNEVDMLNLINKMHSQLLELDKKVDTLIHRSLTETKSSLKPAVNIAPVPAKPRDHNNARIMHTAICADCKKECTIPFKPSGDRPVYCKDCFSRRKVISMSGMKIAENPKEPLAAPVTKNIDIPKQKDKTKKKTVTIKKTIVKKKPVPKKK